MLAELGVLPLDRLLDHRTPDHFAILTLKRLQGIQNSLERFALLLASSSELLLQRARGSFPDDVIVVDELVTVLDQQIARLILHSDANDILVVLFQL